MKNKKILLPIAIILCLTLALTCIGCTGFSLWGDDSATSNSDRITDNDESSDSNNSQSKTNNNTSIIQTDTSIKDSDVTINSVTLDGGKAQSSLADVVDTIHDSVVEINAGDSAGSGVIVSITSNYSYIWTCQHVVDGASEIKVILTNGEKYDAIYCGGLADKDVAVIKIAHTEGMTAASIRNLTTSPLRVGEDAIVIGNPLGSLGGTVTKGIISATARELNLSGTKMTLLQTDASINGGNSGGGLFDSNGLLVGIVNAKATGSNVEGLGFAIPIDTVSTLANELTKTHNSITNAYNGLGYIEGKFMLGITSGLQQLTNGEYVFYVSEVDQYGSFGQLIKAGDYIKSINGNTFTSTSSLADYLANTKIGDTCTIVVYRQSKINYFQTTTQECTLTTTIKQYVYGYVYEE